MTLLCKELREEQLMQVKTQGIPATLDGLVSTGTAVAYGNGCVRFEETLDNYMEAIQTQIEFLNS